VCKYVRDRMIVHTYLSTFTCMMLVWYTFLLCLAQLTAVSKEDLGHEALSKHFGTVMDDNTPSRIITTTCHAPGVLTGLPINVSMYILPY